VTFEVDAVCNVLGNWTVRHYAIYGNEIQSFDFNARVSLDSLCATTLTSLDMDTSLVSYDSNTFDVEESNFFLGSTAYFLLEIAALQEVIGLTLDSVAIEQYEDTNPNQISHTLTLGSVDDFQFTVLYEGSENITFSFYLPIDQVKGGESAVVSATVSIDYLDRRRQLVVGESGHTEFRIVESVERRFLTVYLDKDNKFDVAHVISLKSVCIKPETNTRHENYYTYETTCDQEETNALVLMCEDGQWNVLHSECGETAVIEQAEESLVTSSESLNTTESNSRWEIIFFILVAVTVSVAVLFAVKKFCYSKDRRIVTQGRLSPVSKPEVMLDIQETTC